MVYLFLADGFEEIEALCVLDFLRRGGIETKTVGVSGKIACCSHGIPVTCDITEKELDTDGDFDMVIYRVACRAQLILIKAWLSIKWFGAHLMRTSSFVPFVQLHLFLVSVAS